MKNSTLRSIALAAFIGIGSPVLLSACGSTPTRESPGQYVDDATITTKVKSEFFADKTVDSTNIKVVTYKGTVQLSGFAKSQAEINKAVQIARNVTGVQSVKNDVLLKAAQ
ncbi:MAG: BON domain-containing protein [Burkholderiaceae bacterium]